MNTYTIKHVRWIFFNRILFEYLHLDWLLYAVWYVFNERPVLWLVLNEPPSLWLVFKELPALWLVVKEPPSLWLVVKEPLALWSVLNEPPSLWLVVKDPSALWLVLIEPSALWLVTIEPSALWLASKEPTALWLVLNEPPSLWLVVKEPHALWLVLKEPPALWLVVCRGRDLNSAVSCWCILSSLSLIGPFSSFCSGLFWHELQREIFVVINHTCPPPLPHQPWLIIHYVGISVNSKPHRFNKKWVLQGDIVPCTVHI